jgi:hypothetical protein
MKYYYYEIRESDGNDCRVYDCIVEAENKEQADQEVSSHFEAEAKANDWESDGDFGYFFPCDCEVPEMPEEEIPCPDCEMVAINGVPCHETGCPQEARLKRIQRQIDNFECQGHGGLTVSDAQEFDTEDEAEAECASYHSRYYI